MLNNINLKFVAILLLLIVFGFVGITYAYFSTVIYGNESATGIIARTGSLSLLYETGNSIHADGIVPGWNEIKTISITNTGTHTVSYNINLIEVSNTFTNDDFVYSITGESTKHETIVPYVDSIILYNISIDVGEVHVYNLKFEFKNKEVPQNENQGKVFSSKLIVDDSAKTENLEIEYVKSGLVMHFDGINNTGIGHSSDTTVWKDLSGLNNDLNLVGTLNQTDWKDDGFYFLNNKYFQILGANVNADFPYGSSSYTIEITYDIISPTGSPVGSDTGGTGLFGYGANIASSANCIRFLSNTSFRHYWFSNDLDFTVGNASGKHIITLDYDLNMRTLKAYFDGILITTKNNAYGLNTPVSNINIGKTTMSEYLTDGKIMSVRVYNRALTADEILYNLEIDENRFGF